MKGNNPRRLFYLLAHSPELLSWLEDSGSFLQYAVWWNQHHVVEWLLQHGADPDLTHDGDNTPLISAAFHNQVELARLLLDFGANIEKPNAYHETPIGFACAYDAVDVVRLLCERGANVNGTEDRGYSYLWVVQCESATNLKQAEIEQILVAFGAQVIQEEPKLRRDE